MLVASALVVEEAGKEGWAGPGMPYNVSVQIIIFPSMTIITMLLKLQRKDCSQPEKMHKQSNDNSIWPVSK